MSNQKNFYEILNEKLSGILGTLSDTYEQTAGNISLWDPKYSKFYTIPKYENPPTLITNSYRESKESNGYNYKLSFTSDFDGYAIIEFGTKEGVSNFDCFVQTLIDSVKVDKRPFLNSWNRYMLPVAEGNQVNVDVYIANTTTPGQIVSFNAYKILSDLNQSKVEQANSVIHFENIIQNYLDKNYEEKDVTIYTPQIDLTNPTVLVDREPLTYNSNNSCYQYFLKILNQEPCHITCLFSVSVNTTNYNELLNNVIDSSYIETYRKYVDQSVYQHWSLLPIRCGSVTCEFQNVNNEDIEINYRNRSVLTETPKIKIVSYPYIKETTKALVKKSS